MLWLVGHLHKSTAARLLGVLLLLALLVAALLLLPPGLLLQLLSLLQQELPVVQRPPLPSGLWGIAAVLRAAEAQLRPRTPPGHHRLRLRELLLCLPGLPLHLLGLLVVEPLQRLQVQVATLSFQLSMPLLVPPFGQPPVLLLLVLQQLLLVLQQLLLVLQPLLLVLLLLLVLQLQLRAPLVVLRVVRLALVALSLLLLLRASWVKALPSSRLLAGHQAMPLLELLELLELVGR